MQSTGIFWGIISISGTILCGHMVASGSDPSNQRTLLAWSYPGTITLAAEKYILSN